MYNVMLEMPFQSLTGSIHTRVFLCACYWNNTGFNPSQVQFTRDVAMPKRKANSRFQSLTGSIHTFEVSGRDEKEEAVSIPHRFNSHLT